MLTDYCSELPERILHGNTWQVGILAETTDFDRLLSHELAGEGEADELASATPQHVNDASHHKKHQ
jgi:hypothetical protein